MEGKREEGKVGRAEAREKRGEERYSNGQSPQYFS